MTHQKKAMNNVEKIEYLILTGKLDKSLNRIESAITRQRQNMAAQIRKNDWVKVEGLRRGKAMNGGVFQVDRVNPKTFGLKIPIDPMYGRFGRGGGVSMPHEYCTKVDPPTR